MAERYVVMEADEARKAGVQDVPPAPLGDWGYDHDVLVDTFRNSVVWQDRTVSDAPEDMYLFRSLSAFVDELNRLAKEAARDD